MHRRCIEMGREEVLQAIRRAESEAEKVSKEGDSAIGSIHDGGEGSREDAVNAVLDAFRS